MDMVTVQQVAVAFSAVLATLTFVYKVVDDRKSRRDKEILDWQKTVVHQIFQKNKAKWLSFELIIATYRGEAADVPAKNLPKDVLTSAALRKILISMVSDRVVDQRGGDEYQLLTMNRDDSFREIMGTLSADMMQGMSTELLGVMTNLQAAAFAKSREAIISREIVKTNVPQNENT